MSQVQSLIETLTLQGIDLWVDNGQLRYRAPKAMLTTDWLEQLRQQKAALLLALATTTYQAAWEQQSAWDAYQRTAQKDTQQVVFVAQLHGALDLLAFQRAWQTLVQRHPTLRTTYHYPEAKRNGSDQGGDALLATVHGTQALTVTRLDAQNWRAAELQAQIEAQQSLPFDLRQGPLLRVMIFARAAQEHVLLVSAPRIAVDDASLAQLLDEVGLLYAAAQAGEPLALSPVGITPAAYAHWQAEQSIAAASNQAGRALVADADMVLNLPIDYPRPALPGPCSAQQTFQIDPSVVLPLNQLAAAHTATLDALLLAAFQVLLQRYSGQTDLLIAATVTPRHQAAFRDLVGGFTLETVLPADLTGTDGTPLSVAALLQQVEQRLQTAAMQVTTLPATLRQVAFAVHHLPHAWHSGEAINWGPLTVTPLAQEQTPDTVELKIAFVEVAGALTGTIAYSPDLFAPATVARLVGHLQILLAGMVANPDQTVAQLPMLTTAERQQIVVDWNNTATDYPQDQCLHQLFEAQAARTPDAVAVLFAGGRNSAQDSTFQSITYRELNARANQLARHLQALGVGGPLGAETLVGICVERSLEMVVGLLGILKAGGAYVPLDPHFPAERITLMVEDSAAPVLLTQAHLRSQMPTTTAQILCIDEAWPQIAEQCTDNLLNEGASAAHSSRLAYVIYTSGSTGRPKGVQIGQRALTNFLCSMQSCPGFTANDTLLSVTTLSFDIAGLELYLPLITGGKVVLVDQATTHDGNALAAAIVQSGATVMQATPATWRLLLTAGWQGLPTLRIFCGGEALPRTLADQLLRCGKELWNLYGPTETTIWSTFAPVVADEAITIGGGPLNTVANTQLYVLDAALQPLPIGVSGELHIGGDGVARGYLHRPELTAEKFIADPFAPAGSDARLYKTGDLVRWRLDEQGQPRIEYVGRIDHQVKIRGFRIEQGEIETVLRQHPAVQEAVVAVHEVNGDKQLVAYLTPSDANAYPVRQLLRWEREGRLADLIYGEMPNRMTVFYHNRSELEFLYREILAEESYLHHGITLPPGSCIFDVGANIGMFSLFAHQQCQDATIYSFEPIPPIFKLLRLNTELYGVNAKIFNCGLASASGTASFTYYPQVSVASTRFGDIAEEQAMIKSYLRNQTSEELSSDALDDLLTMRLQGEQITCQFKTLSEVIAEQGITQIDLLKVDTEKSEYDILLGIAEEDWPKIKQIVLEVHEVQLADIRRLLEEHGFHCETEIVIMLEATGLYNLYAIHHSVRKPDQLNGNGTHPSSPPSARRVRPISSPLHLTQDVQAQLRQKLPDYMVPSAIVLLDALPLTPNGKVDKKALPKPQAVVEQRLTAIVQPESPAEATLAQIWREILNRAQVSVHDKFMELGGHSLQAMQVVARINQAFSGNFSVTDFFKYPTIRDLADHLTQNGTDTTRSDLDQGQERGAARRAVRRQAQQRRTSVRG
ncbi:MAG: amino acid adenylation domain-containing protein [Caldilineaceae bacterium]